MASTLPNNVYRRAVAWAGQLTQLAKQYAPNHLKNYISSHVEPNSPDAPAYTIKVTVDINANPQPNYGSLDARAQEYGDKIFAPIQIVPKNAKHLVFMGTNDFVGKVIVTNKVNHPGIEAANGGVGYLNPAVTVLRERGKAELSQDVRQAILSDLQAAWTKNQLLGHRL